MKFLLDTNFLLIPVQFKVDIFSELTRFGKPELYTLDLVKRELERLKSKQSKIALELIKKKKVKILKTSGRNTDSEIIKEAGKGFTVCTQDRNLIKELKSKKISVISLRQKKYLMER